MAEPERRDDRRRRQYIISDWANILTEPVRVYAAEELQRLQKIHYRNIQILRQRPWQEISGAFGDLGTLFPIFTALAANKSISVSSTLVFSGVANVLTGICFGIPLPVQPMKAIAAIAIAEKYMQPQIASAGLFVGAVIGLLSITGLVQWFTRVIPLPIVKGIQVGTGISLMISAMLFLPTVNIGSFNNWGGFPQLIIVLLFLFFCNVYPRTPFVLVLIILGISSLFPYLYDVPDRLDHPHLSLWKPAPFAPSWKDFGFGAINAGLGQIPLTTLNSIVAVTHLAADLVPEVHTPSSTAMGISVSAMNLFGCWFGAMPVCHGSGGLASQYRFGARSGSSVIIFGMIKLLLGLFAAEYAVVYCQNFAKIPLGLMLFLAGLELSKMGESLNAENAKDLWEYEQLELDGPTTQKLRELSPEEKLRRWNVMFVTVGALLAAKNDGVGFMVGLGLHQAYRLLDWIKSRRSMREGQIWLGDGIPTHGTRSAEV